MDKTETFNKLQYSKFIGQDQVVVRSNDWEEFVELIGKVVEKFPASSTQSTAQPSTQAPLCKECGSTMTPGKNGKPYCKPCYIKWKNANKEF